jgi:hypothetical protein
MRHLLVFSLFLLALAPAGCTRKPVTEETAIKRGNKIQDVTCIAVNYGLVQLAKKDKALADKTAAETRKYIQELVLPFLTNQEGISTLIVHQALEQKLLDQFSDDVRELISLAAVVLDQYIPAPAPDKYLSKEHVIYLTAFFKGLDEGCAKYSTGTFSQEKPKLSSSGNQKWFPKKK